jgi:protein SCO1/2
LLVLLAIPAHAYIDKSQIGWDQRLGASLPLNLQFQNADSQTVRVGDYFTDRPVVLAFVYFSCPELCPEVLGGINEALNTAGLNVANDYELVAVSIDPHDTPALAAKRRAHFNVPTRKHVHILTASNDNAARLARAAGFRYLYDAEHQQYAHPAGFLIATPAGKISRYFSGVRFDANKLHSAIDEAGRGDVSAFVQQILLVCFHFDPTRGPYSAVIMTTLRSVSVVSFCGIAIWLLIRTRRRRSA